MNEVLQAALYVCKNVSVQRVITSNNIIAWTSAGGILWQDSEETDHYGK